MLKAKMLRIVNSKTALEIDDNGAVTKTIEIPSFGNQLGRLTQFGCIWLDVDKLDVVDFDPSDGCGAEIAISGSDSNWHLCDEDAAALLCHMQSGARRQISDIKELEAMTLTGA